MKNPLVALALTLFACDAAPTAPGAQGPAPSHVAKLDLFVMSKCPYGVQVEEALAPVRAQLGNGLEIEINYIGQGEAGALKSMHGESEVRGDIVQLCADKVAPEKAFDFIACQNQDWKNVDTNWEGCATSTGIDLAALKTCADGDEGQALAAASFAKAQEMKAKGSPTIFLDGKPYQGGRKTSDFMRAICGTYGDDKPQACKDLPVPPKVTAIMLTDSRCAECDVAPLEAKLKGVFAGLEAKTIDYNTPEGQALYAELQAADPSFKLLPAALFTADVEADKEGWPAVEKYTAPLGSYKSLRVGAKFDPKAEICGNTTDDDADGAVDCADDSCAATLACRTEEPKTLDLFVMSQCPYGAKALIAAADAMKHFGGDDLDLKVHFIGDEKNGELTSMHGPSEVEHDLREICAQERYPKDDQFIQYMACFSKDYKKGDWKACAVEAGMSPDVIQSCVDGEGRDLLRASFAEAKALDISSSPTFLVNNRRTFNAIAADKLQAQYCQDNPGLQGCAGAIATDASASAPPAACE